MEEVKQVIIALKDKLMERHLMSKKIAELEKILQKINDATNEIIIEINNRVDDLNRDWQERLQNENAKWKNDMQASHKYFNRKGITQLCNSLTKIKSSREVNNDGMWRVERRLLELTDRLAPIQKMEQKLEEIIEILRRDRLHQLIASTNKLRISESESVNTAKAALNSESTKGPNFYGVVEITENYSMVIYFI
uniref:Tektin n=1 Tax=Elaeophora elaphi TaxID=1147741 RepID=A0A0R3RW70_9BILA